MIFLYILIFIILFFTLILSLNLKLYLEIGESTKLSGGIGPVILNIFPKKTKSVNLKDFSYKKHNKRLLRAKKRKEKKSLKKQSRLEKNKSADSSSDSSAQEEAKPKKKFSVKLVGEILELVIKELPLLLSRFKVEITELNITVGGSDAAAIGNSYGVIAQTTAYIIAFLEQKTRLKKIKNGAVSVKADFLLSKTKYSVKIKLKLSLFSILRSAFHTLIWMIKREFKNDGTNSANDKNADTPNAKADDKSTDSKSAQPEENSKAFEENQI